ncbi:MAG: potassium channel family protein [Synechococcaceae cyanobacterium]|jgi:voltage-gated potassium channel
MAAAEQPRRTRLHAQDAFYRQLLVLCLLLSVAMCLPPPASRFSHVGFLMLTLLLARGLAPRLSSSRGFWNRSSDHCYGYLAGFTILIQVIWLLQPALLSFSAPLLLASYVLFIGWSLMRLLSSLSHERAIDSRLLSGATAGYLLLGLSGGLVLSVLESALPGGFRDNITSQPLTLTSPGVDVGYPWDTDFARLVYYAFVCLTTVGFGDITPVTPLARLVSMSLSVLGPLYIAVVLGLLLTRFSSRDPSGSTVSPPPVESVQERR